MPAKKDELQISTSMGAEDRELSHGSSSASLDPVKEAKMMRKFDVSQPSQFECATCADLPPSFLQLACWVFCICSQISTGTPQSANQDFFRKGHPLMAL